MSASLPSMPYSGDAKVAPSRLFVNTREHTTHAVHVGYLHHSRITLDYTRVTRVVASSTFVGKWHTLGWGCQWSSNGSGYFAVTPTCHDVTY